MGLRKHQAHVHRFCLLGFSGPSMEDGIGLFLSAFFLLGLIRVLGWLAAHITIPEVSKEKATAASLTIPRYSKKSQ